MMSQNPSIQEVCSRMNQGIAMDSDDTQEPPRATSLMDLVSKNEPGGGS